MPDVEQEIIDEEELLSKDRLRLVEKEKKVIELKVPLRKNTIRQQFEQFIDSQNNDVKDSVYLNEVLLEAVVVSYYYDIHRYKEFSGSKWANRYKQAAYTIKWIVKFRPIQIRESAKTKASILLNINSVFALTCAASFLDDTITNVIREDKEKTDMYNKWRKEGERKKKSLYDKLLYMLRYRPLSGKQLISMFETLELACK
jgi:hypothetical protein